MQAARIADEKKQIPEGLVKKTGLSLVIIGKLRKEDK